MSGALANFVCKATLDVPIDSGTEERAFRIPAGRLRAVCLNNITYLGTAAGFVFLYDDENILPDLVPGNNVSVAFYLDSFGRPLGNLVLLDHVVSGSAVIRWYCGDNGNNGAQVSFWYEPDEVDVLPGREDTRIRQPHYVPPPDDVTT